MKHRTSSKNMYRRHLTEFRSLITLQYKRMKTLNGKSALKRGTHFV